MADVQIKVEGLAEAMAAMSRAPGVIERNLAAAMKEIGKEVIGSDGLQKYPPATAANLPPTPFYIRGRGTQYGRSNAGNSERYGTQFYARNEGYASLIVGNRASYAQWLTDADKQARIPASRGWRKLVDVATEKADKLAEIASGWIARGLKQAGLS